MDFRYLRTTTTRIAITALSAATLLSACGGDDGGDSSGDTGATTSNDTSGGTGGTTYLVVTGIRIAVPDVVGHRRSKEKRLLEDNGHV